MTWFLRQSTASQEIPIGPLVDATDGNTPETGLTIANTDIKLFKTGATTLANKNSGGATHISTGIYYAVLDATDTDTLGPMKVIVHQSANARAFELNCVVLDETVYDALIAASANLTVTAGSVTDKTGYTATASNTSAIADAVWDEAASGHITSGTFGQLLGVRRRGTAQAGGATTITLDASASASDDAYNGQFIAIVAGTGAGQINYISDYVGATKVATVSTWVTNPDSTSVFIIY